MSLASAIVIGSKINKGRKPIQSSIKTIAKNISNQRPKQVKPKVNTGRRK